MNYFVGYKCSLCAMEYDSSHIQYTCPKDGGNLDVVLDYATIRRNFQPDDISLMVEQSLWRYLPLLPVSEPKRRRTPLRAAGWTPIYSPQRLAVELGLQKLWIKDESRNPTASFKDRASALVVARSQEIGVEVVVTASTGNAGAALAGMAAAVDQKAVIFAPRNAPAAKIAQLLVFGAQVFLVDGTYDDAFDLSIQASEEFSWYCRNTGYNPFTAEGKKTAAFEIWELIHSGVLMHNPTSPLNIFVSVGDGNIISGIHKGFKDLEMLGWINHMPRLYGVQAEGSAAIANAFDAGQETINPVSANTLADSISVDLPRDGVRAVRACRETGGSYVRVTDQEILDSIAALGKAGIFAEPAGAAAYAGLQRLVKLGRFSKQDPVLVINTGNGLKDIKAAMECVPHAPVIEPSLKSLIKALGY
ncbi:MAG: threonine synthase [Anaerolineales bacterium]|nr:threonine synthase [Anaerolineales bacterium]